MAVRSADESRTSIVIVRGTLSMAALVRSPASRMCVASITTA